MSKLKDILGALFLETYLGILMLILAVSNENPILHYHYMTIAWILICTATIRREIQKQGETK